MTAILRDDRGDPLADRAVAVRLFEPDGLALGRRGGRTDSAGRFVARYAAQAGSYRLEANYEGDADYRGVQVAQEIDLSLADVRLTLGAAGGRLDRVDLDRPTISLRVTAESDAGSGGLHVQLENELHQPLAEGRTDAGGAVRLEVSTAALGSVGAGRIIARTDADDRRGPAQTEVFVVRFRPTEVTLQLEQPDVEAGDPVALNGTLTTSRGPIGRKAIGIFAGSEHLETLLTDARGRFAGEVVLSQNTGQVSLIARFASDAPWRPEAASAPVPVTIRARGGTPARWLLIPIGLSLLVLLLIWRFSPGEAARERDRESQKPPSPPGIEFGGSSAARESSRRDVQGVVLDTDSGEPIEGAWIRLESEGRQHEIRSDRGGAFRFETLDDGRWTIRASTEGFQPREASFTIPHRGRLAALTVRLRSLRQIALGAFDPLGERLAPKRRWWAFWTPRELARRAPIAARAEIEEVARDLEEIAYAAPLADPDQVEQIGQRSQRLADELGQDRGAR